MEGLGQHHSVSQPVLVGVNGIRVLQCARYRITTEVMARGKIGRREGIVRVRAREGRGWQMVLVGQANAACDTLIMMLMAT
jgi:hypothetical protein